MSDEDNISDETVDVPNSITSYIDMDMVNEGNISGKEKYRFVFSFMK
jgi:hypothetical protein